MDEKTCDIANSILYTYYDEYPEVKLEWIDSGERECLSQKEKCLTEGDECANMGETDCTNETNNCEWNNNECIFTGKTCSDILSNTDSNNFTSECNDNPTCSAYTTCKDKNKNIIYDIETYIKDYSTSRYSWILDGIYFILFFIIIYVLIEIYLNKDKFKLNDETLRKVLKITFVLLLINFKIFFVCFALYTAVIFNLMF